MTDYQQLSQIDFLPELRGQSLAAKAETIQRLLQEQLFAPDGLMYSMPLIDGANSVRPTTAEDIKGTNIWGNGGYNSDPWMVHCLTNEGMLMENSVYTAGLYLRAQAWRHGVTHCAASLREARRAFVSLDRVYQMNVEAGHAGFFAKPYGSRATLWSSADQHLGALTGLWAYRGLADATTQARIDRMFVDTAEFAMRHDYQLCLGDLGGWKFKDEYAFYAVFMLIVALAWRATGEERFHAELLNLNDQCRWKTQTELDHWRAWGPEWVLINEQGCISHFVLDAGEVLFAIVPEIFGPDAEAQESAWRACAEAWWRFSFVGMNDEQLVHYWKLVNTRTGQWRPTGLQVPDNLDPEAADLFVRYQSDVRHSCMSYRMAPSSLATALHCPAVADEALALAGQILSGTVGNRLRWMIDPDGRQLLPPLKWMGCLLESESPYLYLMTYWRGRQNGLWA